MTLLEDLKNHLINNGITDNIYLNFSSPSNDNVIVLWLCEGMSKDIGRNAKVQFIVKNVDMALAEQTIERIFNIVYPKDQFQKTIIINGTRMRIKPIQEPFYNLMDENNRHTYVFNALINYERN